MIFVSFALPKDYWRWNKVCNKWKKKQALLDSNTFYIYTLNVTHLGEHIVELLTIGAKQTQCLRR